jgi:hypothetical protein
MITGQAYYNWGRWVVDCPTPGCTDSRAVYNPETNQRQTHDTCARGHYFEIEMPPPGLEASIAAALSERPHEADQSWYPKGHARALLAGQPTGQTVQELVKESAEVAAYRAAEQQQEKGRLAELLETLGVAVRPDGTFEGRL